MLTNPIDIIGLEYQHTVLKEIAEKIQKGSMEQRKTAVGICHSQANRPDFTISDRIVWGQLGTIIKSHLNKKRGTRP